MSTPSFKDCCTSFADSYEVSSLSAMRAVERTVLGCDYGGTSWTTKEQAERMVEMLALRPGVQLLDVGAGAGWPGLFLAKTSGSHVTLVDLPSNALRQAQERAYDDGVDDRVNVVQASGTAMPFDDGKFDSISHSDVLCCLPEKIEMLKECRRVASDDANMHFSVIAVAQGLRKADQDRAVDAGPPFVDAAGDYADLLSQSGWQLVERVDVTGEHKRSLSSLVDAFHQSDDLVAELGQDAVREASKRRREQIAAIDAGLLCREMFLAVAD